MRQLVVFLHGYGADGNDLIEIGRAWQGLMPNAAFASPHAPELCGKAQVGNGFRYSRARSTNAGPASARRHRLLSASWTRSWPAGNCRRQR